MRSNIRRQNISQIGTDSYMSPSSNSKTRRKEKFNNTNNRNQHYEDILSADNSTIYSGRSMSAMSNNPGNR